MSNIRVVSTIHPVRDPSSESQAATRRDFFATHYVFTRTQDSIAIHSKSRPDEIATVVPVWNVACYSVETAMPPDIEPVAAVDPPKQGKRK